MKKSELREIIREAVFEKMTEELCKKGKAYIAKRKIAGENHQLIYQVVQLKYVKVKCKVKAL